MSDGNGLRLTINEEVMRSIVGKAILEGLPEEAKTEIIQTAVNYVVAPRKRRDGMYGREYDGPSPLEEAFQNALAVYADVVAREYIENNEQVKATLTGKIADLFAQYEDQLQRDYTEFFTEINKFAINWLMTHRRDDD